MKTFVTIGLPTLALLHEFLNIYKPISTHQKLCFFVKELIFNITFVVVLIDTLPMCASMFSMAK